MNAIVWDVNMGDQPGATIEMDRQQKTGLLENFLVKYAFSWRDS